ncbi:asparagine synthase (glutamine-hydrolyzing) (plasmid) [Gloeothece citriformis PCC 7424]|uniref:asparagine synthase (glutamine-hydrolyzing) n=1 Tax=Gloeothece citriformis (strain PCC 7424) TaxID=65393 RepID=B7KM32_GLOC7|nr:asparagine synthase (glutamine-hydrolyzing) [Gloeothece citriformis]ACK73854.1 asparagine synthase (glutamine-hydrolyzing) [Gloeothece citriformis PCC 7424]
MCGIAGIYNYSESFSLDEIRKNICQMTDALTHRGPDDHGVWCQENIALGHRRLSILDLSPLGGQPMFSNDRNIVTVFNGEIYNFQELKRELEKDYSFQSQTDTEVIIAAYKKWGEACVEKFSGMFAFALWDISKNSLFLARDHLGIKPLYYYQTNGLLLFASEIRSLLATSLIKRSIDPISLKLLLSYQTVPAPRSILQDVQILLPGNALIIKNGQVKQWCYWKPNHYVINKPIIDYEKSIQIQVAERLQTAVKNHLVSDVPLGVFLSGGIDSSTLVGLARQASLEDIHTVSIIFDEPEYNELSYISQVAERFQTQHTNVHLSSTDLLKQLPKFLEDLDRPTGDGVNSYVVSQAARDVGLTVVLSGTGGDELFGGYPSFSRIAKFRQWFFLQRLLPKWLRKQSAYTAQFLSVPINLYKLFAFLGTDGSIAELHPITREVFNNYQINQLLSDGLRENFYINELRNAYSQNMAQEDIFNQISYAELITYLRDLLLIDIDQTSMAHGLEVRVPFLDKNFVEFVLGLPGYLKAQGNSPKSLLTCSFPHLLPSQIQKRNKQGFTLPFEIWMKGSLKHFCEERLAELNQLNFSQDKVWQFWKKFQQGDKSLSWSRLWLLVVLSDWCNRHKITI